MLLLLGNSHLCGAEFAKEGTAFLQKYCISCHGEKKQSAELALHTIVDEKSLLAARKKMGSVQRVLHAGEMPPKNRPQPTVAEREEFLKLVKTTFELADRNAKPDPGQVTVRRLNKVEYANTVRDLVGIDFNPAEDFPADDIGYGFDNIGDVLTVSPVLFERYLAAAESIMSRAIIVNPPKSPERYQAGKYLEPGTDPSKIGKFRAINKGNLNTPYRLTSGGEYLFKCRCYSQTPGSKELTAKITINGKEIKTVMVPAGDEKKPTVLELPLTLPKGEHRVAVQLVDEAPDITLHVEWFYLKGPMDTRPETQQKLLAVDPTWATDKHVEKIMERFASRAYRRPTTPDEVQRLVKLVQAIEQQGKPREAGFQLAMQAVLVSPKFLFRIELDLRPDSKDPHPISEYQLASRLSYFLWASMPDEELFQLAQRGQLSQNLEAQVARMLKDPKAKSLVDQFVMQWLQLQRLYSFSPDSKQFPKFDERLRSAMIQETRMFFEELIREDRSILDMIDGNYTYLNGRLATHYGIADTKGNRWDKRFKTPGAKEIPWDQFVRVELPPGHLRGGILTHASILTVTSNPTRTSPVKRGKFVLEQIMGTPPPPAPADVPPLKEDSAAVAAASLRERMIEHRKNPACANCHVKMDDMGFAFENFDAVGGFRTKDGNFDIDPAGILPDGQKFANPNELKTILKGKQDLITHNLAEKMLIYAIGRGTDWYDKRSLDQIVRTTASKEHRFSALVGAIVQSDPFRLRRGSAQKEMSLNSEK
ncbi:MAG: DUF1592 domain-containing protein [Zavarzinella sp.]